MVQLGQRVKDTITGFAGVVTGRVEYITGCNQVLVAPPVTPDGRYADTQWLDEQRVDVLDAPPITLDNGTTPGCGAPPPRR